MNESVSGGVTRRSKSKRENDQEHGTNRVRILGEVSEMKILPGEVILLYLHKLKTLLNQAMPGLAAKAKQQLLVHQFLAGLPVSVSQQL